jgi:hypothetical protein
MVRRSHRDWVWICVTGEVAGIGLGWKPAILGIAGFHRENARSRKGETGSCRLEAEIPALATAPLGPWQKEKNAGTG